MNWKIWVWVPLLYGLFSLWYFNWQGPLNEEEIEKVMQVFDGQQETANTSKALFRKFLEEDDGGEGELISTAGSSLCPVQPLPRPPPHRVAACAVRRPPPRSLRAMREQPLRTWRVGRGAWPWRLAPRAR